MKRVPTTISPISSPSQRGLTLVELLTVLAIVGVLFGIGLAGYRSFAGGMEERALMSRVMTLARQARNSTTFEHAPAAVILYRRVTAELVDPPEGISGRLLGEAEGRVHYLPDGGSEAATFDRARARRLEIEESFRAVGYATVAMWHLEDEAIERGFGGRSLSFEEVQHVPGWLGKGIRLGYDRSGQPTGRSVVTAEPAPDDAFDPFALSEGGRIEIRVRADVRTITNGATIFRRAGGYELVVFPGGELEGGTPDARARTEGYVLAPGVWTKLALVFSSEAVAIFADDVIRGGAPGAPIPRRHDEKLRFGAGFFGEMDEIRVQRRIEGDAVRIPTGFDVTAPDRLVFDARGRLDPAAHTGPARFRFERDGRSAGFNIQMSGRVESDR